MMKLAECSTQFSIKTIFIMLHSFCRAYGRRSAFSADCVPPRRAYRPRQCAASCGWRRRCPPANPRFDRGYLHHPGSEVQLAVAAKAALAEEGIDVRVVSMPSMDVFDRQVKEYQEKVLPNAVRKRVAIEALSGFGWGKYVGLDGKVVAMPGFGASAPANLLFEKFGFTVDNVVATVKSIL